MSFWVEQGCAKTTWPRALSENKDGHSALCGCNYQQNGLLLPDRFNWKLVTGGLGKSAQSGGPGD